MTRAARTANVVDNVEVSQQAPGRWTAFMMWTLDVDLHSRMLVGTANLTTMETPAVAQRQPDTASAGAMQWTAPWGKLDRIFP